MGQDEITLDNFMDRWMQDTTYTEESTKFLTIVPLSSLIHGLMYFATQHPDLVFHKREPPSDQDKAIVTKYQLLHQIINAKVEAKRVTLCSFLGQFPGQDKKYFVIPWDTEGAPRKDAYGTRDTYDPDICEESP